MTREEQLIKDLCLEVIHENLHSERFTRLWLESGIRLEEIELEIIKKLLYPTESHSHAYAH